MAAVELRKEPSGAGHSSARWSSAPFTQPAIGLVSITEPSDRRNGTCQSMRRWTTKDSCSTPCRSFQVSAYWDVGGHGIHGLEARRRDVYKKKKTNANCENEICVLGKSRLHHPDEAPRPGKLAKNQRDSRHDLRVTHIVHGTHRGSSQPWNCHNRGALTLHSSHRRLDRWSWSETMDTRQYDRLTTTWS